MARATSISAKFEQVLFYLDGPQLVVLEMGDKSKLVAVATDTLSDRGFFGAKVSIGQFEEYLSERFDLRYMLANPDREKWFQFDWAGGEGEKVALSELELTPAIAEQFLPDHGLFERDNNVAYAPKLAEARSVQRFEVAGSWAMREFSKLHTQMSDLYALSKSIDVFLDQQADIDRKRKVMSAFVKPFEGGGSYLGLFRSLAKAGGRATQPDIKAINWASPGYIEIFGETASFDKLIAMIDHYGKDKRRIEEQYEHLWSYLQEHRYLKRSSQGLDRKSDVYTEIGNRAKALAKLLNIVSYRSLKSMSGNDALIAAKVLLATKRRVGSLYDFFSEGRLAIKGEQIG
jgi:hypothetical protein